GEGDQGVDYRARLAQDPDFPLDMSDLDREVASLQILPIAQQQVDLVLSNVKKIVESNHVLSFNFQTII
ncbi:MAG: hypothetical protein ACKOFU_00885, partial [Actinomycetota bacterium]